MVVVVVVVGSLSKWNGGVGVVVGEVHSWLRLGWAG